MKTPHSEKRQQVWLAGWTNALSSCIGNNPAAIADRVLKDFDERFPNPDNISMNNSSSKIIPERDTFNVPPEYPNGDDLTPKYDQEDLKCINNECAEDCKACKLDYEEKPYLVPGDEEKLNYEVIVECPACNCIFDILGHVFENVVDQKPDTDGLDERKTPERDTNTYLDKI